MNPSEFIGKKLRSNKANRIRNRYSYRFGVEFAVCIPFHRFHEVVEHKLF